MTRAEVGRDTIFARLREALVTACGVASAKITPEADLVRDLGMDSLDVIEVVRAMEDAFGITIGDADLRALQADDAVTVDMVVDLVERLRRE